MAWESAYSSRVGRTSLDHLANFSRSRSTTTDAQTAWADSMAALEKPASPSEAAPLSPAALPDSTRSRRRILAALWAVVLLGVPLWWHTTELERKTLPEERIQQWSDDYQERIPALHQPVRTDQGTSHSRTFSS